MGTPDLKVYSNTGPMMGCDPELFLESHGEILGAEKVIPKEGLPNAYVIVPRPPGIVLDGVQVELHPYPHLCRANMANELKALMRTLKETSKSKGFSVSFRSVVKLKKAEMDSLSEESKQLGCTPSKNVYQPTATVRRRKGYLTRSAAGHIHLSLPQEFIGNEVWIKELVTLMDILVGIPAVLIDRDPLAAERRKTYGRAGEFRMPPHGVEYRTLSNFWLRAYPIMSLMFAQVRMALAIKRDYPGLTPRLLNSVDLPTVEHAINLNDLDLAKQCYYGHGEKAGIRRFIEDHVGDCSTGLTPSRLETFDYVVQKIWSDGIAYWFPDDPLTHWTTLPEGHTGGWETFADVTVPRRRQAEALVQAPIEPTKEEAA